MTIVSSTNFVTYITKFVLFKGVITIVSEKIPSSSEPLEERMSEAIRKLLRMLYVGSNEADVEETRLKLSVLERQLMGLLLTRPGLMTKELAAFFAVQTTTMASILERLADSGLIEKQKHPSDKRAIAVTLTTLGKTVIEAIRARDIENCRGILAELSEERQLDFVEDLERMASKLEQ